MITEDFVRDGYTDNNNFIKGAKQILGFDKPETNVKQGTGQITTFKQLGFICSRNNKKPDGWYLPNNLNDPAIVLETKNSDENLDDPKWVKEIKENSEIIQTKYKKVIGILYNGNDVRVFKNGELLKDCGNGVLQNKKFYLDIFNEIAIDKQEIYRHTKSINENLHANFGVKNLNHRMIFTACALVAERYGANLKSIKNTNFVMLHTSIHSTMGKALQDSRNQNQKLDLLLEVYSGIKMNLTENVDAINMFIDDVCSISESLNSSKWNGEDVMAIFFNEFNRYKGKSESGQVFTPDHIVSLMYRLLECNQNDVILDAACGSGTFLVKSMANMINEAGGPNTAKAKEIKSKQLYGVEFDKEIFALACANMLIHKDGKTNLIQDDTRGENVCKWIKSKPITKVLMNPPYENKYGCMKIVENVLNNVRPGTMCAFILPDKKLEKTNSYKLLKKHTLKKIVKLPEKTFDEGITTSIFIFEAGKPQMKDNRIQEIFTCKIDEDGLERVKTQRRQDIHNKWNEIEDYWVDVCYKQSGDESIKWIKPSKETLSYPNEVIPFKVSEEDFVKTVMDYEFFKRNINIKTFNETLINQVLYSSKIRNYDGIEITLKEVENEQN